MSGERERREFEAGLSEEVDAWLRGDTSRREFLGRLAWLGGGLAAGAGAARRAWRPRRLSIWPTRRRRSARRRPPP